LAGCADTATLEVLWVCFRAERHFS